MATRKTLINSRAGVRLQRIEHLAQRQAVQSSWRLSTMRQNPPRSFADEASAPDAFDMEVVASLSDPIIFDMQRRGLIDEIGPSSPFRSSISRPHGGTDG